MPQRPGRPGVPGPDRKGSEFGGQEARIPEGTFQVGPKTWRTWCRWALPDPHRCRDPMRSCRMEGALQGTVTQALLSSPTGSTRRRVGAECTCACVVCV